MKFKVFKDSLQKVWFRETYIIEADNVEELKSKIEESFDSNNDYETELETEETGVMYETMEQVYEEGNETIAILYKDRKGFVEKVITNLN